MRTHLCTVARLSHTFSPALVTVHGLTVSSSLCCVCVWVCLIEADSLQLRIIYRAILDPVTLSFVVRSLDCLPCPGQWFPSVPAPWFRDSRSLPFPGLHHRTLGSPLFPCATCPNLWRAQPGFLSFTCLTCFSINRSCFRSLNPPVFICDSAGFVFRDSGWSSSWSSQLLDQQCPCPEDRLGCGAQHTTTSGTKAGLSSFAGGSLQMWPPYIVPATTWKVGDP